MCRKIQHARIDNAKALSNLICGKSAVGGNYNSTRDNILPFGIKFSESRKESNYEKRNTGKAKRI